MRALGVTAILVGALLATGFQHALRLCPTSGHAPKRAAVAAHSSAGCEHHGAPAPAGQPSSEGPSSCCSPEAALVARSSQSGATLLDSITAFAATPTFGPSPVVPRLIASASPSLPAEARPKRPFRGVRAHLALRVIVV